MLNNGTATAESGKINLYDIETAMGKSGIIKSVTKSYIDQKDSSYNASKSTVETCNDKLWLLACSEIWNNGYKENAYGYAGASEGEQYKFYKDINATYSSSNSKIIKYDTSNSIKSCWLRSPAYNGSGIFCILYSSGICNYNSGYSSYGVAPGFAI